MTAITVLEGAVDRPTVPCIICQTTVPLHQATAGSLHADGTQAFACQVHIKERSSWIAGWAIFEALQHERRDILRIAEDRY